MRLVLGTTNRGRFSLGVWRPKISRTAPGLSPTLFYVVPRVVPTRSEWWTTCKRMRRNYRRTCAHTWPTTMPDIPETTPPMKSMATSFALPVSMPSCPSRPSRFPTRCCTVWRRSCSCVWDNAPPSKSVAIVPARNFQPRFSPTSCLSGLLRGRSGYGLRQWKRGRVCAAVLKLRPLSLSVSRKYQKTGVVWWILAKRARGGPQFGFYGACGGVVDPFCGSILWNHLRFCFHRRGVQVDGENTLLQLTPDVEHRRLIRSGRVRAITHECICRLCVFIASYTSLPLER